MSALDAADQPSQVEPGLWVSGVSGLACLTSLGITHVVSVVNGAPPIEAEAASCTCLHLDVEDLPEADLLQHLPTALHFISSSMSQGGRVLVHCAQGVSRSAAVVTAHLMRSRHLAPAAALQALRLAHPGASPNPGFLEQLRLFGDMGCGLDPAHMQYKRYMLEQTGRRYDETGTVDAASLAQPEDDGTPELTSYRCRKCRSLVATSHNVVPTEQGAGVTAFAWRKRDRAPWAGAEGSGDGSGGEQGSLFVEPLRWMAEAVGHTNQGKLYCPKCTARLGSFNWSGSQSSSGAWVTPAFQLHLGRLDATQPRPTAALAFIRQPKQLPVAPAPAPAPAPPNPVVVSPTGVSTQEAPPAATPAPAAAAEAVAEQLQAASLGDSAAAAPSRQSSASSSVHPPASAAAGEASPGEDSGTASSNVGAAVTGYFSHLILDCDGVMVDSERPSCLSLRDAILDITGFDIPHDFPIDFRPVFGMDVRSCVEYYQRRFDLEAWGDAAAVTALADQISAVKEGIYRDMTASPGSIAAFPGVAELVAAARAAGMGVAVASSGSPDKIAHNLESSGLQGLVPGHLIVSAKHVARGKPAPDVYLEALRRLGCADASRALVVEDAVNGLKAAKGAGCFTVGVTTSLPAEDLGGWADVVVASIGDLDFGAPRLEAVAQLKAALKRGGL